MNIVTFLGSAGVSLKQLLSPFINTYFGLILVFAAIAIAISPSSDTLILYA